MKKVIFLSAQLMFLSASVLYGQDVLYKNDILPPSPEASAFIKNVNIPVSYSSGTPQISIPFGSVKSGGIEVPVSISYNASGIRVEEVPTWVGLGWSLSAGGQITRSVRDKPDELSSYGYINEPYNRRVKYVDSAHCRCINFDSETWAIESDIQANATDLEPDQFSFSVLGYSGDFYYNQDSAKFILVPYQNIQIQGSPNSGYFILTLPDGVKAYFGNCSSCTEVLTYGTTSSYVDGYSQAAVAIGNTPQTTSWLLTSIVDPTGKEVDLSYTSESIISFGRGGERFGTSISDPGTNLMRRQSFFKQYITKPILTSITGESGNIYFKKSSAYRLDMPNYNGGSKSLDTILITNTNNEELRSYYFSYGYFTAPTYPMTGILDITTYADEARNRLYLKSITEKKGTDSIPPYLFTYNDVELPSRFSTSQDYWGYYNGKPYCQYLMPRIPLLPFYPWDVNYNENNHNLPPYGQYLNFGGADRRIDTNYNQARILKKVKYPTGGTTEYFYESNQASVAENLDIYGGMEPPDMVDKSYSFSLLSNPLPVDPPYPLYYAGTFDIKTPATKIKINPQLQTCTTYNDAACKLTVKLKHLPDSTLITTITTTNIVNLPLAMGTYLVEVFVNGSANDYPPSFQVDFQWGERLDSLSFLAGGLRLKKAIISDSAAGNNITRSYRYKYEGTNKSSGMLEGIPTYKAHDINSSFQIIREYYASNSAIPLTDAGKTVRYEFVSEFSDSAQSSFKTNYTFTSGLSDPLKYFAGAQTGAPLTSWNWQNNLLKKKEVFEKTAPSTYRMLSSEENFYQFYQPVTDLYGLYGPQIIRYSIATEWYLPDSTHSISYSYVGGVQTAIETGNKTLYNDKYLTSVTKTYGSKAEKIQSKIWYPSDYNNVSGYNIATLFAKHILSIPIKSEVSVNGKIRSGNIIKYNELAQPTEGYSYNGPALADTVTHDRNTVLENNYLLLTSLRYNTDGSLKQQTNYKTGPVSYIWDYQINGYTGGHMNILPVAMIQNADSNNVAYSSFEEAGTGNWTLNGAAFLDYSSPMGKKCFYFNGTGLTKTGLNSGTVYVVSYWSKNGSYSLTGNPTAKQGRSNNGWTYYEYEVTGVTTLNISGTGYIDELRLYPKGSLMTTVGYKYGIGVASQCDANNHITYYEYDNHNRLSLVRDQDNNIVKKICYNYSGQVVDCGFGTLAAWQSVSSTCEQTGGSNTGNLIITEKDMNPSSSTYNQTRTSIIYNAGACFVCNSSSCSGVDKKCVNGICETGTKIYTGSVSSGKLLGWTCYYHYHWSDGSDSPTYSEFNSSPCTF